MLFANTRAWSYVAAENVHCREKSYTASTALCHYLTNSSASNPHKNKTAFHNIVQKNTEWRKNSVIFKYWTISHRALNRDDVHNRPRSPAVSSAAKQSTCKLRFEYRKQVATVMVAIGRIATAWRPSCMVLVTPGRHEKHASPLCNGCRVYVPFKRLHLTKPSYLKQLT